MCLIRHACSNGHGDRRLDDFRTLKDLPMTKILVAALIAASTVTAVASSASARPMAHRHQVCTMRHHHRVCVWR
jgi:hypothetical protein